MKDSGLTNGGGLEAFFLESDGEGAGLPAGVLFLHDNELRELDKICARLTRLFERSDYRKVSPPLFEFYETFEKGSGADIARKTFSFKDKEGKLLSLRYDMTTPIARMVSMLRNAVPPLRYYYCEDVLREQPLHKGKLRQMKQAGVELIGAEGLSSDAEIVTILGNCLEVLDKDYRIVMGDVGMYKFILSKLNLKEKTQEAVHKLYNLKDVSALEEIIGMEGPESAYKRIFLELPYIVGSADSVREKLRGFPEEFHPYFDRLLSLERALPVNIKSHIIVDMGLIKDFSYYTSLTLEGYIRNSGYPAAGGGRYDKLFQSWGRDYPAVGFGLDVGLYNNIFKKPGQKNERFI